MTITHIDTRIKKIQIGQKGYGFTATDFIPKNTVILSESPSFKIKNYRSNKYEIFELIYTILTSDKEDDITKFIKYLPRTVNNNFSVYTAKIINEFNNYKIINQQIYKFLVSNYSLNDIVLFSLKYICNAFDFFEDGPIILLNGSIFNHSCNPNIIFGKDKDGKMIFLLTFLLNVN